MAKNPTTIAPCADLGAAVEHARTAVLGVAGETAWELSPPFPGIWPPSGEPEAVFFANVRVALPTSTERWSVRSPFLRVDVPLGETPAPPRLTRLDVRPLEPNEGAEPPSGGPGAMDVPAAALLEALCAGAAPSGAAAETLRAGYHRWARQHAALAGDIRRSCPAFFAWLEET